MELYETLRNKRIELGLSQKTVGENIKVAQSTLCRFEQGYKMQNKDLITHKLINFYKNNDIKVEQKQIENVKVCNNKSNKKDINKKDRFEIMSEDIAKKFEKIFKNQLEKEAKRIYKKTLKQLIKEL